MSDKAIRRPKRTGRSVVALTVDRLDELPHPCRSCAFWERTPAQSSLPTGDAAADKRGWLAGVALSWGTPGRMVYVDEEPAGYLVYAPGPLVPRAMAFPTSPVSDDALVLVTARVVERFAGQGLGRVLVQSAAKQALRRGYRALEAFAATGVGGGSAHLGRPGRSCAEGEDEQTCCVLPVDFLTAVGFATVREHAAYPRMRLDLRTALAWRADVEHAVERLFAPIRGLQRPPAAAGTSPRDALPHP